MDPKQTAEALLKELRQIPEGLLPVFKNSPYWPFVERYRGGTVYGLAIGRPEDIMGVTGIYVTETIVKE